MKEDFNMVAAIIVIILVLVVIFAISTYNSLVKKGNACEEAFSTMDVYLKKRYDLIPNLVNTVKKAMQRMKKKLWKKWLPYETMRQMHRIARRSCGAMMHCLRGSARFLPWQKHILI